MYNYIAHEKLAAINENNCKNGIIHNFIIINKYKLYVLMRKSNYGTIIYFN